MMETVSLWPLMVLGIVAKGPQDVVVDASRPSSVAVSWLPAMPDGGRWGHAAVQHGNEVFVFGGNVAGRPESFNKSNSLMHFDVDSREWSIVPVVGPSIPPRSELGFARVSTDELMVAAGNGGPGILGCLKDTWRLSRGPGDVGWQSEALIRPNLSNVQGGVLLHMREAAAAALLAGGCGSLNYRRTFVLPDGGSQWVQEPWGEEGPRERVGHVAALDEHRSKIYLWGGQASGQIVTPDEYYEWSKVWSLDWRAQLWLNESDGHSGPSRRSFASGAYDNMSGQFLVFGGHVAPPVAPAHVFGDLWAFDANTREWRQIVEDRPELARTQAAAVYCACEGGVLVTGGRDTPVSVPSASPESVFLIRVEHDGKASWVNEQSRGSQRILEITPSNPSLSVETASIQLMNCATGEVLAVPSMARRSGKRWMAHFNADWKALDALIQRGEVVVRASITGDNLAMVARFSDFALPTSKLTARAAAEELKVPAIDAKFENGVLNVIFVGEAGPNCSVDVFDVAGRRVAQIKVSNAQRAIAVDGSDWARGVYFVRAQLMSDVTTARVVKI